MLTQKFPSTLAKVQPLVQYSTVASVRKVNHDTKQVAVKYTSLFINNENVKASSGRTFDVYNPTNGKVFCQVQEADQTDVDRAVKAAAAAEKGWANMDNNKRSRLLHKWADLIERDTEYIAELESLDNGKPIALSKIDVSLALDCLRYFAGWCDKIEGRTMNVSGEALAYTLHEPIGVVGQIVPWNFPLLMFSWKAFPALATGNVVVLKPAETTPLSSLYAANLAKEAGFPPGVLNIVPGLGPIAGEALARHSRVEKIAFTGSTLTGRKIMIASGETNLKKVQLELGGKSPLLIMKDACSNMEGIQKAAKLAYDGIFFNQGQVCCASSRVYVHEDVYDEFVHQAAKLAEKRVVGNPFEKGVEQGPQNSEMQMNKILKYIESAKQEKAKIVTGGKRISNEGYFIEPTVIADNEDHMKHVQEEIFGPVVSVLKYKSIDEVITRANKSDYGLAAGVVTNDLNTANKVIRNLKAGTIWLNTWNSFHANVPFGGFKQSGFGRDLGVYALDNYTQVKAVVMSVPGLKQ